MQTEKKRSSETMQVSIKKGKGIDDLISGDMPIVDTPRELITAEPPYIQNYIHSLKQGNLWAAEEFFNNVHWPYFDEILTPPQINAMLQLTAKFEYDDEHTETTGMFISRSIQDSFLAGHNDFVLDTDNIPFAQDLAANIQGTEERRLVVTINGNAYDSCGSNTKYCDITVHGEADDFFGSYAEHLNAEIHGDVGEKCGFRAETCQISIHQDFIAGVGISAKNSIFRINGKEKRSNLFRQVPMPLLTSPPERCIYIVKDHSLYHFGLEVPKGNRVIFIRVDGSEEIRRDYSEEYAKY